MSSDVAYKKQMRWKAYQDKKLEEESNKLSERHLEECTFSPVINMSRRVALPEEKLKELKTDSVKSYGDEYHTKTSTPKKKDDLQAEAMKVHVARQEKARLSQKESKKRLATKHNKNYDQVTAFKPFKLSVTNKSTRKDCSSTDVEDAKSDPEVCSDENNYENSAKHSKSGTRRTESHTFGEFRLKKAAPNESNQVSGSVYWERDRSMLLSIIDNQREEMQKREKAQKDAKRAADQFSSAILVFEERLQKLETENRRELLQMKSEMMKQSELCERLARLLEQKVCIDSE